MNDTICHHFHLSLVKLTSVYNELRINTLKLFDAFVEIEKGIFFFARFSDTQISRAAFKFPVCLISGRGSVSFFFIVNYNDTIFICFLGGTG